MTYRNIPHFTIKKNLQKSKNTGIYFSDILNDDVLSDVCYKITGKHDYTLNFVENDYKDEFLSDTYNKGRLAILQYESTIHYISFSENRANGRNSSVQSVPTAFNIFFCNSYPNKKLHYYFLDTQLGNFETDYLIFMYRLMATIGFNFLNADNVLTHKIKAFSSIEDIIFNRKNNSERNKGNNSTYITKSGANSIDIYGKVYGANKYESSMLCYALSLLCHEHQKITLYEIIEKDLKRLPEISRKVIEEMGVIKIIPTDITLEKQIFKYNDSLRSPRYIYNLLDRIGPKQCVLCECSIPELIQGAHIWSVSSIKKEANMIYEEKLNHAINGHNGLWLCENHHKLFDENILMIKENGTIYYQEKIPIEHREFIAKITTIGCLPEFIMSEQFVEYLWQRNKAV